MIETGQIIGISQIEAFIIQNSLKGALEEVALVNLIFGASNATIFKVKGPFCLSDLWQSIYADFSILDYEDFDNRYELSFFTKLS